MKFWEMVSAFRERKDILEKVLHSSMWQAEFWNHYRDFESLDKRQDRQILDAPVPIELSREIAAQCHDFIFHFDPEKGTLHRILSNSTCQDSYPLMTALDVHDKFGGSIIEEVIEKGSANVEEWR